jgi:hypothetical protein
MLLSSVKPVFVVHPRYKIVVTLTNRDLVMSLRCLGACERTRQELNTHILDSRLSE